MAERGLLQGVADEGGWWPAFSSQRGGARNAGARDRDAPASRPAKRSRSRSTSRRPNSAATGVTGSASKDRELDRDGLTDICSAGASSYPIVSIEDPLAEDDAEGFAHFTAAVGDARPGDRRRLPRHQCGPRAQPPRGAIGQRRADQAQSGRHGHRSEGRAATKARRAGFGAIVSARSGETEDVTIVHLAIGWGAGQLKVGSFARSERMAKWNEVSAHRGGSGPEGAFCRP